MFRLLVFLLPIIHWSKDDEYIYSTYYFEHKTRKNHYNEGYFVICPRNMVKMQQTAPVVTPK